MTHHVYVAYDKNNEPLYVGCTNNLHRRMDEHAQSSRWYSQACFFSTVAFPTRREALAGEADRITTLRPRYNQQLTAAYRRTVDSAMDLEQWRCLNRGEVYDESRLTVRDRKWLALRALRLAAERASA